MFRAFFDGRGNTENIGNVRRIRNAGQSWKLQYKYRCSGGRSKAVDVDGGFVIVIPSSERGRTVCRVCVRRQCVLFLLFCSETRSHLDVTSLRFAYDY